MKRNNLRYTIRILLAVLMALSITACGSGGGGSANNSNSGVSNESGSGTVTTSTVSGVAAIGAPLADGEVYVKDASGTQHGPYPIDANGNYSIDVTGFNNPPFYLRAEGTVNEQPVILYSVSMNPGTANVNPLTNLAIAAASGLNPEDVYNDPLSHSIEQDDIENAINDILTLLAPILNNSAYNASDLNPLTDENFEADGSGLDGVFDDLDLDIDITDGTVTILLKGVPVGQAALDGLDNPTDDISAEDVEAVLTVVSVSGFGINSSGSTLTVVNVNSSPLGGTVTYYDALQRLNFSSTSITGVSEAAGIATITGVGSVTDLTTFNISGYTFTAKVTNGTTTIQLHSPQTVINGNYSVTGTSVSGFGINSSGSTLTVVNVNSSPLGGMVTYYDALPRLNFVSASISGVSGTGGSVTITGAGSVTDISSYITSGYTFNATVTAGTATIQLHSPQTVINGNYSVTIQ